MQACTLADVPLSPRLLSSRLQNVLELVRPCAVLADVGTDHALLPIAAVQGGLAARAVATDLREGPLVGARANIERAGVADRVIAVRGDGLAALQHLTAEAVVIAGMSGGSMLRMFEGAPDVLSRIVQLIVQPNQNVAWLRAWALRTGWHLRDERMLEERGRFFVVCAFTRGTGADPAYGLPGWTDAASCSVGPWLLARRDPVALRFCERQRARVAHWVARGVSALRPELLTWQAACQALQPGGLQPRA